MPWHIYIVRCSDKTLYTGISNDVSRRIRTHNRKKGALYTKFRVPVRLAYTEEVLTRSAALVREREIKKLTHKKKLELIRLKKRRLLS